ncbi:MAG: MarR family transcriptional regulator [Chloroflexi bacterium]|nr:MAG: MarR family transcriptional regulator [Chloroflexota bacterium]
MCNYIPQQTLGYLLAQVCKAHVTTASAMLAALGIHVGQEMVLLHLWDEDGLTQTELGERLCVRPATVTKMLGRMEHAGLVERRKDPDDQRVSRVWLTEQGCQLETPLDAHWAMLEARAFGNFSDEERQQLRHLLERVYENLTATDDQA